MDNSLSISSYSQPAVTNQTLETSPAETQAAVTNSTENSLSQLYADLTALTDGGDSAAKDPVQMLQGLLKLVSSLVESLMQLFGSDMTPSTEEAPPTKTSTPKETPPKGNQANEATANSTSSQPTDATQQVAYEGDKLQALLDDKGLISVLTNDGYTIQTEGKEQAWYVQSPDGKKTRIWGDPHVVESDGDKWNFKKNSSFKFGDNKITVETTPAGNGETLTQRITVYNGKERVTISGIDKDKPVIAGVCSDARVHDAGLNDGDVYALGKEKNGDDEWRKEKN